MSYSTHIICHIAQEEVRVDQMAGMTVVIIGTVLVGAADFFQETEEAGVSKEYLDS